MRSARMILLSLMLIFVSQPIFSQTDQANEIRCATGTACTSSFIPKFSSNGGSATVTNSIVTQSGSTVSVAGNVSATQLISKAASGTPPIQVSSMTRVPNLNASFVDGLSASAFANLHASSNLFTGSQFIAGSVGIGTTTASQRLDLGNNGNVVVKTDPGNDTTEGDVGYGLIGRGVGGAPNGWWILTAPVGGGFGVRPNSFSVWQYPPNQDPGCCLERLAILPSTPGQTVSPVAIDGKGHLNIESPSTVGELFSPSIQVGAPPDGSAAANFFGFVYVGADLSVLGCVQVGGSNIGNCVSDARLKKDIQPFPPVLDKLAQLQPVSYDWRTDEFPQLHLGTARSSGLIAQEVESVFPEMVSLDNKGFKRVNYGELPALMLQAIRELKVENDDLREHIQRLENAAAR